MSGAAAGLPGIRRRLASAIYDSLLLLGVVIAALVVPHMLLGLIFHIAAPRPMLMGHLVIVFAAYFLWYWRHGGQTLAMQTWKIRLTSVTGSSPSWPQLLLRFCSPGPASVSMARACYGRFLIATASFCMIVSLAPELFSFAWHK